MYAPFARIHRVLVLTTLAVSTLIAVIPAQAQHVGARQWFANSSQKCLYQFNGRNWINIGGCQWLREVQQVPPHRQQAVQGTSRQFKVGNLYCQHILNAQGRWANVGNCRNISGQQAAQEDAKLNHLIGQLKEKTRQLQAAQAAAGIRPQVVAPRQAAPRQKSDADINNELAMGVYMNGLGMSTQRQITNAQSERANRDMEASADRHRAEMARLQGADNAKALEARAQDSANRR